MRDSGTLASRAIDAMANAITRKLMDLTDDESRRTPGSAGRTPTRYTALGHLRSKGRPIKARTREHYLDIHDRSVGHHEASPQHAPLEVTGH